MWRVTVIMKDIKIYFNILVDDIIKYFLALKVIELEKRNRNNLLCR